MQLALYIVYAWIAIGLTLIVIGLLSGKKTKQDSAQPDPYYQDIARNAIVDLEEMWQESQNEGSPS